MKKLLTIALIAAGMAFTATGAKAQYMTGDLMMGFENNNGMDVLLDLGSAQTYVTATAPFSINIGNLNSALIAAFGSTPGNSPAILTAVFGNLNRMADGGPGNDPANTLYASQLHALRSSGSSQSGISTLMSQVEGQYNNEYVGNLAIVQNSGTTPNTYFSQVVGQGVFTNFVTESQFNLGTFTLDRVFSTTNGGGPTQTLGTINFSFDGNGNVTGAIFNPTVVPEPSTYALGLAGAALVVFLMRRRARANQVTAA